ncbi:MAG: hypothetical protein H0T76_13800 [Nannocystis sp.]|nr:hypothetical protein [Nannocystis sp.]MBA3547553.1 hypothetical protein [Nannocystis sp.]
MGVVVVAVVGAVVGVVVGAVVTAVVGVVVTAVVVAVVTAVVVPVPTVVADRGGRRRGDRWRVGRLSGDLRRRGGDCAGVKNCRNHCLSAAAEGMANFVPGSGSCGIR